MITTYTTITDVIDQYVRPALGEYAEEYDLTAIAQDITEWRDGNLIVTEHGEACFYEIAERHEITR